jgi:hypothetical protein
MEKMNVKLEKPASPRTKRSRKLRSTGPKQNLIVLPAIEASETKKPFTKSASKVKIVQKPSLKAAKTNLQNETFDQNAGFLPEYRSQTDGLRELLSSIDPHDKASYSSDFTSPKSGLTAPSKQMPHSGSGIPGSPDLPTGPTRWGLYLSATIGMLAFLFASALAYSHVTSPTGIDWAKLQSKTTQTYQWVVTSLEEKPTAEIPDTRTAQNERPIPLPALPETKETSVATSSRISTTAASPIRGTIKTPSAAEIFISPEELENQIRALESASASKALQAPQETPENNIESASNNQPALDELVVVPASNIDPDVESQIFKRASSYLKQRDISSARMILQYAAKLGSGISAMALAETFDPNYLKTVNFDDVSGSRTDARKWYNMAARLGIKEANARLTALK